MVKAVRSIAEDERWVNRLAAIGAAPSGSLQPRLAEARAVKDKYERAEALAKLAPGLSEPLKSEVLTEALKATRGVKDEFRRAEALKELARHLLEPLRPEALKVARSIKNDPRWRAEALRGFIPCICRSRPGATALVTLAPRIAELGFPEAALVSARVIDYEDRDLDDRPGVLACVAPYLARLPRARLYPLWRETLYFLAIRTRPDLLADLGALVPVIVTLGGAEAVVETLHAVLPTGRRSQ